MTDRAEHIARLIVRELNGEQTIDEADELKRWRSLSLRHYTEWELIMNEEAMVKRLQTWYEYDNRRIAEVLSKEFTGVNFQEQDNLRPGKIMHGIHFLKTAWFRYAAAILLIIGIGTYLWNNNNAKEIPALAKSSNEKDILPGTQRATLTLADGSTIVLDSAANGKLTEQNGSSVMKKGNEIIYDPDQYHATSISYNTMSTPRGGQYQLTLSDGTKVWLNAASSISFPTKFIGRTREVTVTGEVYMEVAKNKERPFIVKTGNDYINVLGTSFNINNYPGEFLSKISLIEGAVKINDKVLKPGQAFIHGKIYSTNINQDIAWINGAFDFNGVDLQSAMKQIARWYDVEIQYEGKIPNITFYGKMGRDLKLNQVLKALATMGVHYELSNKTLTIKP